MTGQTIETRFAVAVHAGSQAMGAVPSGLLDWAYSHAAAGGAGETAHGINPGAFAKGAANVGSLNRDRAASAADTAGRQEGHDAEGIPAFAPAEGAGHLAHRSRSGWGHQLPLSSIQRFALSSRARARRSRIRPCPPARSLCISRVAKEPTGIPPLLPWRALWRCGCGWGGR